MKNLEVYLNSLSRGVRISISRLLNDFSLKNGNFMSGTIVPDKVTYNESDKLSPTSSQDINMVLSDIDFNHKKLWNTARTVDTAINTLYNRVDNSYKVMSESLGRIKFAKNKLRDVLSKRSQRVIHTETFSDYSGTDLDLTTAKITNGLLHSNEYGIHNNISNWYITYLNVPQQIFQRNDIYCAYMADGQIDNSYMSITGDGLIVKAEKTFDKTMVGTQISFTSFEKAELVKIELINSDNKVITLSESTQIQQGYNCIRFGNIYFFKTIRLYFRCYIYDIVEDMPVYALNNNIEFKDINTYENIGSFPIQFDITQNGSVSGIGKYYYRLNISDIKISKIAIDKESVWTSQPIITNGSIENVSIDADIYNGSYGNIEWLISANGSEYIPIVENPIITNELLDVDITGKAITKYPIDITQEVSITDDLSFTVGTELNGIETYIYINDDNYTGQNVGISYTSKYTGIIRLDETGMYSPAPRIVEAMQDGTNGEYFSETRDKLIALAHVPYGDIIVYSNQQLCEQLPEDKTFVSIQESTTDVNKIYYSVDGNKVYFPSDQKNITVYYFYKESSLRVRAVLTSLYPEYGDGPTVNILRVNSGGSE